MLQALLDDRRESLGIRHVTHDIRKHPRRDPGCLREAASVLEVFRRRSSHALVLFDHDGCGRENDRPEVLEQAVLNQLEASGWEGRAAVLVLAPELEIWVWSESPEVERVFGWEGDRHSLSDFLMDNGIQRDATGKFLPPKEALELMLKKTGLKRSSSMYGKLARTVSLQRCSDPAFARLKELLRAWFPAPAP